MSNNINTMQIWYYINYHWKNTKIKSIQSKLFQCLFYTNKALNLGHLVKVLWKHLNNTNTKGSSLCDAWLLTLHACKFDHLIASYFHWMNEHIVRHIHWCIVFYQQFLKHGIVNCAYIAWRNNVSYKRITTRC
jgi:hypothetical protein